MPSDLRSPTRRQLHELWDLPFDEALRQLRDLQGWSLRQLSARTKLDGGRGLSDTYIHWLVVGRERPARPEVIETLARACAVPPEVFAEYRVLCLLQGFDGDYRQRYEHAVRLDPSIGSPPRLIA